LQRWGKLAYGREKKMIQLKKEINELRDQTEQGKNIRLSNKEERCLKKKEKS
jgi:hypothetical protein